MTADEQVKGLSSSIWDNSERPHQLQSTRGIVEAELLGSPLTLSQPGFPRSMAGMMPWAFPGHGSVLPPGIGQGQLSMMCWTPGQVSDFSRWVPGSLTIAWVTRYC